MATVLVSMLWAAMADSTPEDALRVVDPALVDARAELAARERALGSMHGFDASVTFQPGVSFGTYEADAVPPEGSGRLYLDATLGYSYDEQALLADLDGLERARAAVARIRRRGVGRALTAHARLLQIQLTLVELEEQVALQAGELALLGVQVNAASVPAGSTSTGSVATVRSRPEAPPMERSRRPPIVPAATSSSAGSAWRACACKSSGRAWSSAGCRPSWRATV